MARGSSQGVNAITVWMIAFVALWLASTVFLVILYTGQEDLNNEVTTLRQENDRLISSREKGSIELQRTARPSSEGGPTVVGLLEGARAETALLATGTEGDDPATVRGKRDQILSAIAGDGIVSNGADFAELSLHEGLSSLYENFRAEHARRSEAEDRLATLEAEVGTLVESNAAMKGDFEQKAQQISEQLAQAEADRAAYRTQRDAAVTQLERDFDERQSRNDADLTTERQQRQECGQRLAEARQRYRSLREKLGGLMVGPDELATARKPDGRVLTAIPGDDVVYINLGREDALTLGLQFAVYSAQTGIPVDGRSKAQIEVVAVSPGSAECRIVRVARNAVILEGDLVANPIYDPSRPMGFVVIGEFDIDRDGMMDRDGANALSAMVTNWGGRVSEDITPLTDFVIVGSAPRRPRTATDLPTDLVVRNRARQQAWDRYNDALRLAESLSIPVMTQDVFLSFLGYSARYAQR